MIARSFVSVLLLTIAIVGSNADLTLINVQALIRHGARTPYTILPPGSDDNSVWYCQLAPLSVPSPGLEYSMDIPRLYRQRYVPNEEALPGNCTQGQLTEVGYDMHLVLGAKWRSYYIDELGFLNDTLDTSQIFVRSTDVPRTIQSASANLLGMFPPHKRWSTDIVDIFTLESGSETLVPNNRCPNFMSYCDQIQTTPAWLQNVQSDKPLLNYFEQTWNTTDVPFWIGLWDNFEAREAQGFNLPKGIDQDIVQEVVDIAIFQVTSLYQGKQAAQMSIGPWISEMLGRMNDAISGQGPKWILYSGHDVTFALVLTAFNIELEFWPPYAANLVIELWEDDNSGEYFVQFVYMGGPLVIPGCPSTFCPFNIFEVIAESLIPSNWDNLCGLSSTNTLKKRRRTSSPLFNEDLLVDDPNPLTAYFC